MIWHPYSLFSDKTYKVVKTYKSTIELDNGTKLIDAISSWWVSLHGHRHPYIVAKIKEQLDLFPHVIFGGFTHDPALDLAEKIKKILPNDFKYKMFFSDNGSTAVEVAIKIALQFFKNKNIKKSKIIKLKNSYHGDTFGSMSVSTENFFDTYETLLFPTYEIDINNNPIEEFEKAAKDPETFAFIFEPLIQGAGGMKFYDLEILKELVKICEKNNIITIADEVFTGFYRVNGFSLCHSSNIFPDLLCISKGLTAGFLPQGLTIIKDKIYENFDVEDRTKMLFHGHSYTANPLALAAANASFEVCQSAEFKNKVEKINNFFISMVDDFKKYPNIKNLRNHGLVFAFDFDNSGYFSNLRNFIYDLAIKNGVLLRPLGSTVYIVPPSVINMSELEQVKNCLEFIIGEVK